MAVQQASDVINGGWGSRVKMGWGREEFRGNWVVGTSLLRDAHLFTKAEGKDVIFVGWSGGKSGDVLGMVETIVERWDGEGMLRIGAMLFQNDIKSISREVAYAQTYKLRKITARGKARGLDVLCYSILEPFPPERRQFWGLIESINMDSEQANVRMGLAYTCIASWATNPYWHGEMRSPGDRWEGRKNAGKGRDIGYHLTTKGSRLLIKCINRYITKQCWHSDLGKNLPLITFINRQGTKWCLPVGLRRNQ